MRQEGLARFAAAEFERFGYEVNIVDGNDRRVGSRVREYGVAKTVTMILALAAALAGLNEYIQTH